MYYETKAVSGRDLWPLTADTVIKHSSLSLIKCAADSLDYIKYCMQPHQWKAPTPAAPVVTQKNALYSASLYPKHSSHSSQIVIFYIRWLKQGENTLYTEGNVVSITLHKWASTSLLAVVVSLAFKNGVFCCRKRQFICWQLQHPTKPDSLKWNSLPHSSSLLPGVKHEILQPPRLPHPD